MVILSVFITIVAALLPAIIWLLFFLKEDVHPEPKRLIIYTFCVGAIISLPVLIAQIIFQNVLLELIRNAFLLMIGLAVIEEVLKFFAAYFAVHKDPAFDEPIDAVVYMIAAAMGFASIENIFIASQNINTIHPLAFAPTLITLALRFVGATLLHALASGMVGYFWAKGWRKPDLRNQIIIGIVGATIIHFVFNYLVLKFQNVTLFYSSLFLVVAAFFLLNDFEKLKTADKERKM